MKTVTISSRSKALNEILKLAQKADLIVQSADGTRFFLTRVDDAQTFYVGSDDDFDAEIAAARKNKRFMKFLDERTKKSRNSKRTPIEKVREQLGLNSIVEQKSQIAVKEKKANYRASGKKKE